MQDANAAEEVQLNLDLLRDEQAYQKNKGRVRMITMSWQEFYDQGIRGKQDGMASQEFFPFRKFDVIHIDPPYDWPNHPTPALMKKLRRLLDACSKEGQSSLSGATGCSWRTTCACSREGTTTKN